jgi:GT2 family glycosyltransferase
VRERRIDGEAHPEMSGAEPEDRDRDPTARLRSLERANAVLEAQVRALEAELAETRAGLAWDLVDGVRRAQARLFPPDRWRGHLVRIGLRAVGAWLRLGPREVLRRVVRDPRRLVRDLRPAAPDPFVFERQYQVWLRRHGLTPERAAALRAAVERLPYRPLVSLLMPVYDVKEEWLRAALDSVATQLYAGWELCVVDDGSTAPHIRPILERAARADPRIKLSALERNRGICGASNAALALATGEYVGLLDHDDALTEDALAEVVTRLNADPALDLLYSDHDIKDARGRRVRPFFKPGWSPDLLLSMNYITHFAVARRALVERAGGFREGFEGSQDYDLLLRVTELTDRIAHIPRPLYSWGQAPTSVVANPRGKLYAHEAGRRALADALSRRGIDGEVQDGYGGPYRYRVRRRVAGTPVVTIVIPTRDNRRLLARCLAGLETRTAYRAIEILVVNNQSRDPETVRFLGRLRHRVIDYPHAFDFARINNLAAKQARGDYLLFLNDDTEALEPTWLDAMLEHAQRPEVGAVGARLLFPNRTIQHAGVVVGIQGKAGHAFWGIPAEHPGYYDLARVVRNVSAVTAACLMTRRAVFQEVGGFDEAFAVSYNDVDLCLRLRERGYLVVYTPYAVLTHHQSASRGPYDPAGDRKYEELLRQRWQHVFDRGDPYYNPNLTLERLDYTLRI